MQIYIQIYYDSMSKNAIKQINKNVKNKLLIVQIKWTSEKLPIVTGNWTYLKFMQYKN